MCLRLWLYVHIFTCMREQQRPNEHTELRALNSQHNVDTQKIKNLGVFCLSLCFICFVVCLFKVQQELLLLNYVSKPDFLLSVLWGILDPFEEGLASFGLFLGCSRIGICLIFSDWLECGYLFEGRRTQTHCIKDIYFFSYLPQALIICLGCWPGMST